MSGGHNEPHGRVFFIHTDRTLCFAIRELWLAPPGWWKTSEGEEEVWDGEGGGFGLVVLRMCRGCFVHDQSNDKDSIQSYSVSTTHSIKTTKTRFFKSFFDTDALQNDALVTKNVCRGVEPEVVVFCLNTLLLSAT